MSETKRTAADIEAELEAMRLALTDNIDELVTRLNPRTYVRNVKQCVARTAENTATRIQQLYREAVDDNPEAGAILVGGTVVLAGTLVLLATRRRRRR